AALIQRAKLLNLILCDIYGKRELIKSGLLPLDLVYNHNGFLRACDGIRLPGPQQLFLYAADIGRDREGKLWILNDRTQAPSGSGYALENRIVMSKVMSEISHSYEIRKLTGFFNTLHQSLLSIAPRGIQNPRIVILTPGPENETYFEHAYLSAYLGYHLVHGEDLTVRDGYVWLKTIKGLDRVDIILRRVDDSFCDPLELRPDSRLGVSGLVEAVRRGNVVVANPLGSSILENSAFASFLPGLCRHYFNEELMLPSLNTWWCGQPAEMHYVLENMDTLRIKMIHSSGGGRTISDGNPDSRQKEHIRKMIMARPYLFVANERLQISTVPSLVDGSLDRRFAVLRSFLVAKENSYTVMPGGLTRSSAERDRFKVSNQYGGISKDTWVLGPEPEISRSPVILPFVSPAKDIAVLSSRTAESMYWTGRYAMRAKVTARVMIEALQRMNEKKSADSPEKEALDVLLVSLTHLTMVYPGFTGEEAEAKLSHPEKELLSLILSRQAGGTFSSTVQFLKRAIFAVRNQWPDDTWHIIDDIEESLKKLETASVKNIRAMQQTLKSVNDSLFNFIGLYLGSIRRDDAYLLLNAGRRIEKSLLLISQIDSAFSAQRKEQVEYELMEALLSSNMSLMIYRSRFRSTLRLEAFLDLLLFDPENPSSLSHELEQLRKDLSLLSGNKSGSRLSREAKLLLEAFTILQQKDPSGLARVQDSEAGKREELEALLKEMSSLLMQTSDMLVAEYFSHSESSQQLYNHIEENRL
ncbi:MAG: circularly permuted type 2 ATP-grasp protein, partial [Cytophagaceae bacterium]